jgi:putative SOS response-associated peptidase YedK
MCSRGRQALSYGAVRMLEMCGVPNAEGVAAAIQDELAALAEGAPGAESGGMSGAPDPGEILPTDETRVILVHPLTGERQIRTLRWGIWPAWMRERPSKPLTNARAETITQKPSFREAFRLRRCVVPMNCFYEFCEGRKYSFQLASGELMPVAGIWETRRDPDTGRIVNTCAIVTTTPNERVAEVHDRMPVILAESDIETWLSPDTPQAALLDLLRPYDAELMIMTMVRGRLEPRSRRKKAADDGLFD